MGGVEVDVNIDQQPLRPLNEIQARNREFQFSIEEKVNQTIEFLLAAEQKDVDGQTKYRQGSAADIAKIKEESQEAALLKKKLQDITQNMKRRQEELSAVQSSIEEINVDIERFTKEKDALEGKLAATETKVGYSLQGTRATLEEQEADHTAHVERYSECLGWRLPRPTDGQGGVLCVFDNVDPSDPNREFSFRLRRTHDGNLAVFSCQPEIDECVSLQPPLDHQALGRLIVTMRKRFCEVVTREGVARLKI